MDGQLARPASIRMVLGITALKDWELRQLDVDIAYLEAGAKDELYIELPEDLPRLLRPGEPAAKDNVRRCAAGLLWSKYFSAELTAKGFERCQAGPCVFRRVLRGKVVVIIVVYVDDLLVASETKRDEEQATKDLRSCFPIKDLGRQDSISDATSREIATREH